MNAIFLGTGNANAVKLYNTCFLLHEDDNDFFLVDCGGGNGLFRQLEAVNVSIDKIHNVFISHKHLDHIMGIFWFLRFYSMGLLNGMIEDDVTIYGHDEVISIIRDFSSRLFPEKQLSFFDSKIHFDAVEDKEKRTILNREVTFFDIASTKAKEFGFSMAYEEGKRLCFLGDEPYRECEREYAYYADWLFLEAFCLFEDRDIFKPYEKHHTTVKDAAAVASSLNVHNLVLYHTEDKSGKRCERYKREAEKAYKGNICIPDDLEEIKL